MKVTFLLLLSLMQSAQAADWDAQTTRTNTAVTDSDIQSALRRGISPAFVAAFPSRNYGIHVLVDRLVARDVNAEVTYLSLGICKRQAGGDYSLPLGRYSDLVTQPAGTAPDLQRQAVSQKLAAMAAAFSQGMVQQQSALGNGSLQPRTSSGDWKGWPDFRRATPTDR
jgi:hypothetical protein